MSEKPVKLGQDRPFQMTQKDFLWAMGVVAAVVTGYVLMRSEVASHGEQLKAISAIVAADHNQLSVQGALIEQQGKLLERIDRKLDYVTGASRTRPAPSGTQ